ncbi:gamma-glutamyltransferase [Pseudonocardia sulfidoxydans NBRC 16205]|uniref:Gamma-glutamyltransferase n=1 Tax=Pseudonocardia sulfidoxydans NBRC 16205 TaxID=1223511 RepID=A0A511D9L2_9PSEU|nr:gamma-glutamyltransferase [Pseudonocardia sulfidoxydans]GEL21500.1 gamma-glutamyltransferase [Pseudonocardia sulfidoxydans NBRC 16205]
MSRSGAVAAAHPLAAAAARDVALRGGNAVDAAVAAQAVICVAMPEAAGVGGDVLALVRAPDGTVTAVNGTGRAPKDWPTLGGPGVGNSVTVPGALAGWADLNERFGALAFGEVLEPATRLARDGLTVGDALISALAAHGERLARVSPGAPVLGVSPGDRWTQPALAALLDRASETGPGALYRGEAADAVARAVAAAGGSLAAADLHDHTSMITEPIAVGWAGATVHVQPPNSQGVLLAMALQWLDGHWDEIDAGHRDHVMVEIIGEVFAHRDDSGRGATLLAEPLDVDTERAAEHPGGPRSYLHTAGVATADSAGWVVSSLVSVFDGFGSAIHVPELGLHLNNRADGFTAGANAARPGARPVHTLAPMLATGPGGSSLAMSTPGADGQVQTLLQVASRLRAGADLEVALAAHRWRAEDGNLLVETGHPVADALASRGHRVVERPHGSGVFGSVVAAGLSPDRPPFSASDLRRQSTSLSW